MSLQQLTDRSGKRTLGGTLIDTTQFSRRVVGMALKHMREAASLTQQEAAARAQVSGGQSSWSRYERGAVRPSPDVLDQILSGLGLEEPDTLDLLEKLQGVDDERAEPHYGRFIRDIRQQRGWTQIELARRAGVQAADLNRIEGGLARVSLETLDRILEAATDIRLVDLLQDQTSPHQAKPPDPLALIKEQSATIASLVRQNEKLTQQVEALTGERDSLRRERDSLLKSNEID